MRVESDKPSKNGGWIHKVGDAVVQPTSLPKKQETRPEIDWHAEARKMFEHSRAKSTRETLAASLGVSELSLRQLGVGFGADRREFSSWPERRPDGQVVGIVRRYEDGGKKTMRWSRHGLYFAVNGFQTPDVVLCPEGGSDSAALLTIGLYAIGRPSNVAGVDMLITKIRAINPLKVIVLGERDEKPEKRGDPKTPSCPAECNGCMICAPGIIGMNLTAARLRESLRKIQIHSRLPEGKDVRAWLNQRRGNGDLAAAFLRSLK
jgi:hypothetical protein